MKDTIHYFVRDNLNAFSFNMLVILLLDVLSFIVLFVLVLPLPEMFRRGFAGVRGYRARSRVVREPGVCGLSVLYDVLHVQYAWLRPRLCVMISHSLQAGA